MTEIIDRIFEDLKAEIEKGKQLEPLKLPKLEESLRPFIIRELTPDEQTFLAQRVQNAIALEKLYLKVNVLQTIGADAVLDEEQKENELTRFHSEILDDLFIWCLNESTDWKYGALLERQDGDKQVLVGLTGPKARAYYEEKENEEKLAQLPASTLVN